MITLLKHPFILLLIGMIKLKTELRMHLTEVIFLFEEYKKTKNIRGDVVEVGVYKGGSALVLASYKNDKTLHLIDSFQGLKNLEGIDRSSRFKEGMFKADFTDVIKLFDNFKGVHFHVGMLSDIILTLEASSYSFVNIDLDLYKPTLEALRYFYPRLNKGGKIVIHDYSRDSIRLALGMFERDYNIKYIVKENQVSITK